MPLKLRLAVGLHANLIDLSAAADIGKVDHCRKLDDLATESSHQLDSRQRSAARSDQIVDNEHALARLDRVLGLGKIMVEIRNPEITKKISTPMEPPGNSSGNV